MKNLTVKELKELCKKLGIKGYSRLKKAELVELVTPAFNEEAERMVELGLWVKNRKDLQEKQERVNVEPDGSSRYFGDVFHIRFGYYDHNSAVGGGNYERFGVWYGQVLVRLYVYGEKVETNWELENTVTESTESMEEKTMNTNTNNEQLALEFGEMLLEKAVLNHAEIATAEHYDTYGNPHRLTVLGNTNYYCVYGYEMNGINVVSHCKTMKELKEIIEAIETSRRGATKISVPMIRLVQVLQQDGTSDIEESRCFEILRNMDERVTYLDCRDCYEFNGYRSENPLVIAKLIELSR